MVQINQLGVALSVIAFKIHLHMNCGPACFKIVAELYKKHYSLSELEDKFSFTKDGVSMFELGRVAETLGFKTLAVKIPFQNLITDVTFPVIAFCNNSHYVVVLGIDEAMVYLQDPTFGKRNIKHKEFCKNWVNSTYQNKPTGIALLFESIE